MTGWLIVAGCLMLLGTGAVVRAEATRGATVPASTMKQWRQYATEVERGTRTPSAITTRMLTETAIAQHEYADAAEALLRFVGAGVALLGLVLAVDVARVRARHARVAASRSD